MKLLGIIVLVCSGTAFAGGVNGAGLTKSPDGKSITCESMADNNGWGYRPDLYFLNTDGQTLSFEVGVTAVTCSFDSHATEGTWKVRRFNDPTPTADNAPVSGTVSFENQKFLFKDESGKVLGSVDAENVMMQEVKFQVPLNQLLSNQEQHSIANGGAVKRELTFVMSGTWRTHTSYGEDAHTDDWGSYLLDFTLTSTGGKTVVKNVIFK